jgi:hypothetical protein
MRSEECVAAQATVEQVVRDVVPGATGRVGAHGVLRRGLVVHQFAADGWVHLLAPNLADVVEHAAGAQHDGEVLQLDLGALLQARPARLEARERLHRDAPELGHLLVERVLRPRQVGVRVRHQHPVHERVAGATHQPRVVHHPRRGALVEHGLLEDLVVGHGAGPADADVGEGAVGADDALERDGVGRLLVALRVAAVEVGRHRDLGRDDGDVGGVHGADDARHARGALEALLEARRGVGVGPLQEARHEHGLDGGAHLQDELVAGGDAEAEALGHEAERLPRGEAPDADGDALADGDGGAEHGVLLGHRGAQRVADHVEGRPPHPERAPELLLRVVGAVAPVPPRARPVLDPQPALVVASLALPRGARRRGGRRGGRRRRCRLLPGHDGRGGGRRGEPGALGPGGGLGLGGGLEAALHLGVVVHGGLRAGVGVGLEQRQLPPGRVRGARAVGVLLRLQRRQRGEQLGDGPLLAVLLGRLLTFPGGSGVLCPALLPAPAVRHPCGAGVGVVDGEGERRRR